jgi:Protein of unknown function (DUF3987)
VAKNLFNSEDDSDGFMSRFLPIVVTKQHQNFTVWCDDKVNLSILEEVIDRLATLKNDEDNDPVIAVKMSPDAKKQYILYWEYLRREVLKNEADNPAYARFLGKQDNQVGRLALLLHWIDWALDPSKNKSEINQDVMIRAIKLNQFYCGQARLLISINSDTSDGNHLDGKLSKIWSRIVSKGYATVKDITDSIFRRTKIDGKKVSAATAREMMNQLVSVGYGKFDGNSKVVYAEPQLASFDKSSNFEPELITDIELITDTDSLSKNELIEKTKQVVETIAKEVVNTGEKIKITANLLYEKLTGKIVNLFDDYPLFGKMWCYLNVLTGKDYGLLTISEDSMSFYLN